MQFKEYLKWKPISHPKRIVKEKSKYRLTYIKEVNGLRYDRLPYESCEKLCSTGNWCIVDNEKEGRKHCYLRHYKIPKMKMKGNEYAPILKGYSFIPDNLDKFYKIIKNEIIYDDKATGIYRKYLKPQLKPKRSTIYRKIGGPFTEDEIELKQTRYKRLLDRVSTRKSKKAISSPVVKRSIESDINVLPIIHRRLVKIFIPQTHMLQKYQQWKDKLGRLVDSITTYKVIYEYS